MKHCQSCGIELREGPTALDHARFAAGVCGAEECAPALLYADPALRGTPLVRLMEAQGFVYASGPNAKSKVDSVLHRMRLAADLAMPQGDIIAKMRADNIRTWLTLQALDHATEDQRQRFTQGCLPDEEILTIARAVLFKGFGAFPRWAKSHALDQMTAELRHAHHCKRDVNGHESGPAEDLSAVETKNLAALKAVADAAFMHPWLVHTGGTVTVTPLTHWLLCTCEAESSRSSAKVTITWGERELVREYAL